METEKNKNIFQNPIVLALLALFSCFLWGSSFPIIKLGYKFLNIGKDDTYSKIVFAGIRFTLSSIMVFSLCLIKKVSFKLNKLQVKSVIYLGIVQTFIQYIFFYIGMAYVSGTNGSIISSLSTFISVIMAHFCFRKDKLNLQKIIGILLGLLGIIVLNIKDLKNFNLTIHGEGFVMVSAITSAWASVYTKKISNRSIPPFLISGFQLLTGGILLLTVGLIGNKGNIINFNLKGALILFYMSFISAAAFSTWTILLKSNKVSKVMIYRSSIPLFGVFLSIFLLGEKSLNYNVILAIIFVTSGIILINSKNIFKNKNEQKDSAEENEQKDSLEESSIKEKKE